MLLKEKIVTHVLICNICFNRLFIDATKVGVFNCYYCNSNISDVYLYTQTFDFSTKYININEMFLDITYRFTALKYR